MKPDTHETRGDAMSAVAMAHGPRRMMATNGESHGHLSAAGALNGTDVQHLDVCALTRHAVALLQATGHVETREVQLELPEEPVFARVSRQRLEQVLLHLIADAVDARRSGADNARAVRLTVEPQDDFGDYGPTFRVHYPARELPGPEATALAREAPQAGLKMARELVETLGGCFRVRSVGLTSTTVTVELPDPGTASW
ncbi:sensor histidine kinase [Archangium lipolyticum]|uniref:sensor histidine kinase n=1 Tax=Archangium lipolyticum TaxID=2970465 RepID=UPI002149A862|nr:ATP-binding protein [Archangium lipolyticum]